MSRFAVEWLVPGQPDRLTHVMLLDRERPAPYTVAVGHGADKVHALLNLWRALKEGDAVAEAIDYVAVEYTRRAGKAPGKGEHLTADHTIRDLLKHPAFAGFGHLLLPRDDRSYDNGLRLRHVGSLLPYHSHVDPGTVVTALNHMIDDANNGKSIFYEFYSAEEKKEQQAKSNTGLFFFRGKPGAPFAVITPGGGFSYVGSVHEGFPYAVTISKRGYNAFVLRYRAGSGGAVATRDLAAAISYVFRNAKVLCVGIQGYSLWGSSAGGRMAATIGSRGVASFGGDDLPKPSAVVMAYTGHAEYSTSEPSTFVVVGEHDGIAPPSVMESRVAALRKAGTDVEFHRYSGLGHGFGPGTGTTAGRMDRQRYPVLGEVHQIKHGALDGIGYRTAQQRPLFLAARRFH